jgi:hypothetical protein
MKLTIEDLWSPDLVPPSSGAPANTTSFRVFVQVALAELGRPGREVFSFTAVSPDRLANGRDGDFVSHSLVLTRFSWETIRARLERLLRHTESCSSWQQATLALAGCLRQNDLS